MVSDYVKGKKKFDYPPAIQKGISLHRSIDNFTDSHTITKEAKEIFRPVYRLYSGAFMDIVYDHFLAIDEKEFTEKSLFEFSRLTYGLLDQQAEWLPERFAAMFPYMKSHNWLYNYRHVESMRNSFRGLVRRSAYLSDSDTAMDLFVQHYQRLQNYYRQFWADLKPFARAEFEALTSATG